MVVPTTDIHRSSMPLTTWRCSVFLNAALDPALWWTEDTSACCCTLKPCSRGVQWKGRQGWQLPTSSTFWTLQLKYEIKVSVSLMQPLLSSEGFTRLRRYSPESLLWLVCIMPRPAYSFSSSKVNTLILAELPSWDMPGGLERVPRDMSSSTLYLGISPFRGNVHSRWLLHSLGLAGVIYQDSIWSAVHKQCYPAML